MGIYIIHDVFNVIGARDNQWMLGIKMAKKKKRKPRC